MYPLLPWKLISIGLAAIIALSVYADDLAKMMNLPVHDSMLVRYLPFLLLTLVSVIFGPTGRWAPWRVFWRWAPFLNSRAFPDLNGVWVGVTRSNWSVIERAYDAAASYKSVTEADLFGTPLKEDAIAVSITCSLFLLKIEVATTATDGEAYSVVARPIRDSQTTNIHLINVYRQSVPDPVYGDESDHVGAADLTVNLKEPDLLRGVYWTRRVWRIGKNTAGKIELRRLPANRSKGKVLRQLAAEEKRAIIEPQNT